MLQRPELEAMAPVGMIYDLARKAAPLQAGDLKRNADGSLSKRQAWKRITAATLHQAALDAYPTLRPPWVMEKIRELESSPPELFQRELIRFTEDDLVRVQAELYTIGTELRRAHSTVHHHRAGLLESFEGDEGHGWAELAVTAITNLESSFPRSEGYCYRWRRPCSFMDLCRYQSEEATEDLRVKASIHEELEEKTDESTRPIQGPTVGQDRPMW
jgi:hypothetical protein